MTNTLLEIYDLLVKNESLVKQVLNDEKAYLEDDDLLNASFALVKELESKLAKLANLIAFKLAFLTDFAKELFMVSKYLLNYYLEINGYLIYDILQSEYSNLVNNLKGVLQV